MQMKGECCYKTLCLLRCILLRKRDKRLKQSGPFPQRNPESPCYQEKHVCLDHAHHCAGRAAMCQRLRTIQRMQQRVLLMTCAFQHLGSAKTCPSQGSQRVTTLLPSQWHAAIDSWVTACSAAFTNNYRPAAQLYHSFGKNRMKY